MAVKVPRVVNIPGGIVNLASFREAKRIDRKQFEGNLPFVRRVYRQ